MSYPARSVFIFSLYLFALGWGLILIPNVILSLFGLPASNEVWIRMLGMMTFFVGVFQFQAARKDQRDFFQMTVILRFSVFVFVSAFILAGFAPPIFLLVAVVDVVGASWTWLALRQTREFIPA